MLRALLPGELKIGELAPPTDVARAARRSPCGCSAG
jgi:hypothetical protein